MADDWLPGRLVDWLRACLVVRSVGCVVAWLCGCLVRWFLGSLAGWSLACLLGGSIQSEILIHRGMNQENLARNPNSSWQVRLNGTHLMVIENEEEMESFRQTHSDLGAIS